jgi:hypothetical protein
VTHDILAPLLAEEARLETELKLNPVFRKLEAVRASIRGLREAYGLAATPANSYSVDTARDSVTRPTAGRARRPGSITRRVVEIAASAMKESNERLTSGQVYEMAIGQGVVISGVKPPSVVASILSHEGTFNNRFDQHGSGYGLREWSEAQNGQDHSKTDEAPARAEAPKESEEVNALFR